jgi:hypothetical protein
MRDDFISRLLGSLRGGRVEFQEVREVLLRFVPKERVDLVSVQLEHEALFLSVSAYSLQTPARFGAGRPLYPDEDYHSVLSLQFVMSAETLCALKKQQVGPIRSLFLGTKSNKQALIEKMRQRSSVYYDLKLAETDILRKNYPISAEKRMQHDELLYLPTMREFLAVCSGADVSISTLNPSYEKHDVGKSTDAVTRSLLLRMQVALTKTQFAIQNLLKTSGLTQVQRPID